MSIRTEVNLRLPNSPGALAGVCQLLSDEPSPPDSSRRLRRLAQFGRYTAVLHVSATPLAVRAGLSQVRGPGPKRGVVSVFEFSAAR